MAIHTDGRRYVRASHCFFSSLHRPKGVDYRGLFRKKGGGKNRHIPKRRTHKTAGYWGFPFGILLGDVRTLGGYFFDSYRGV